MEPIERIQIHQTTVINSLNNVSVKQKYFEKYSNNTLKIE
jgi:hypothetical protein